MRGANTDLRFKALAAFNLNQKNVQIETHASAHSDLLNGSPSVKVEATATAVSVK